MKKASPEEPIEVTSSGDVTDVQIDETPARPAYADAEICSNRKTIVANCKGGEHGGHLLLRPDGSGVFRPTSYESTAPHFAAQHNSRGDIEFSSIDELRNRLP